MLQKGFTLLLITVLLMPCSILIENGGCAKSIAGNVVINEILSDSFDEPDGEWIELYNPTESEVNLSNWKISDDPGMAGEGTWTFPSNASISAKSYIVVANRAGAFFAVYGFNPDFEAYESNASVPNMMRSGNLQFANSGDDLTLFDSSDNIVDQIWYGNGGDLGYANASVRPKEGHSIGRISDGEDSDNPLIDFAPFIYPTPCSKNLFHFTPIKDVQNSSSPNGTSDMLGELINTSGIVTAPTDVYNPFTFYIQDESKGILVYTGSTKIDVYLGEVVRVIGNVSEYYNETEIVAEYVIVIGEGSVPEPKVVSAEDAMKEENEGLLLKITGIVVTLKLNNITLNDGTGDAFIYIDVTTGIDISELRIGFNVTFTAIASQWNETKHVLKPRFQSDVEINYPVLKIIELSTSALYAIVGQEFTINVKIKNAGGMDAYNVSVFFLVDNESIQENMTEIMKGRTVKLSAVHSFDDASLHIIAVVVQDVDTAKMNISDVKEIDFRVIIKADSTPSVNISPSAVVLFSMLVSLLRLRKRKRC